MKINKQGQIELTQEEYEEAMFGENHVLEDSAPWNPEETKLDQAMQIEARRKLNDNPQK